MRILQHHSQEQKRCFLLSMRDWFYSDGAASAISEGLQCAVLSMTSRHPKASSSTAASETDHLLSPPDDNSVNGGPQNTANDGVSGAPSGNGHGACVVICWGCGLHLTLAAPTPMFKCGYCGAITSDEKRRTTGGNRHGSGYYCARFFRVKDQCAVTLVSLLITAIIGGGVWACFPPPASFFFPLHCLITFIISANIIFNYTLAVTTKAGQIDSSVRWGSITVVTREALEGFTFCSLCNLPKPPGAHHCRQCGECVLEMDHHCPFIGNCVGARNQRHFLVFLFWVVVGCLYLLFMCFRKLYLLLPSFFATRPDAPHLHDTSGPSDVLHTLLLSFEASFSFKSMALSYLAILGVTTIVGVGGLAYTQVRQILEGQTYIDSLQRGVLEGPRKGAMESLRRIFGLYEPVWAWMLPRVAPPIGSYAAMLDSRKMHRR
eukprot:TRINITY_DN15049_c0_g1_i1.p1 TRINITY_DN15049_c0_g1~~TRINITY_DN15049_c0_g1_i1.p1  ORF type:complete len:433 (-),score=18.83 TRINITY_DN15049_c0_g1_i1:941-2239(-)